MADRLVDTDLFSYSFNSRARPYARHLAGHRLFLSFQSVAELHRWALERAWGTARIERLKEEIAAGYGVILPDHETCRLWGCIMAQARASGRPVASSDAWIAATALRHSLPPVTHNGSHFETIPDLVILSESA